MTKSQMNVAILISGRGSNMLALAKAIADPDYPAQVVGVISDQTDAKGLTLAAELNIPTIAIARSNFSSKAEHEAAIQKQLEMWKAEIVCLAGYMRIFSADFIENWPARFINIHPSLLPKFKGLDTHQRVLNAGDPEHGTTVHYVTAGMDEGPVIAQARVTVEADDTVETLTNRVLVEEHKLYPMALRKLIDAFLAKQ
ncbi:MAG: phosphoribosylglycinamide formyltransferase [Pseudomonadota bacterium]